MLGQCALCLLQKDLQKSHLIPRSMYRKIRSRGSGNNDPMVSTPSGTLKRSSFQYQEYLLCWDCEQLFRKNGEDYAARMTLTKGRFPLLDILKQATPNTNKDGLAGYTASATPTINRDMLAYFAVSVFWRASVKTWYGDNDEVRIELGAKYNEQLRLYLLGKTSVPPTARLVLGVCTDNLYQNMFSAPSVTDPPKDRVFGFLTCGLDFRFAMGKSDPARLEKLSLFAEPERWISTGDCTKYQRIRLVPNSRR